MRSRSTGVGHYNSEYRSFNRGFGHGNSKPFQKSMRLPSPQPTRKGDLFVEAGRLAVDYLVSYGLLSSNVLHGKGENGTLRNNSREFKDYRYSQDKERANSPVNSRSVAVANQRAATPDGVSGSRKINDDDDLGFARSFSRERRKVGQSRRYSFEKSLENGREGSLSDKAPVSHCMEEVGTDKLPDDTNMGADTNVHVSQSVESASKDNKDSNMLDEVEKVHADVGSDSKISCMHQNIDEKEPLNNSDMVNTGCERTKDGNSDVDMEKEPSSDQLDVQQCEENSDTPSKDVVDLLKLCPSSKVPTKVRSSLLSKSPKRQISSDVEHDALDSAKDVVMNTSSEILSSNEIPSSKCIGTALPEHSVGDAGVLFPIEAVSQRKLTQSVSLPDKASFSEQKFGELSELGRCSSFHKDRGEKRAIEEENVGEGSKKPRQWLSVAQSDAYSQFSNLSDKHSILPASRADTVNIFSSTDQENFTDVSLPLKGHVESAVGQGDEKRLFSSSFKICDLNLMEASEMHGNHDSPPLMYPSISAPSKDASAGIGLSMNNCSLSSGYNASTSAGKEIEIIDLENASLHEDTNMPARSMETDIASMESFPNNSQNSIVNPDGQDGYGFMISELLGNDHPNCSSVQPDINSLHNDMGLPHGEGFNEDDPIYMSLGEIPISLLGCVWEPQPPVQGRNPFEL